MCCSLLDIVAQCRDQQWDTLPMDHSSDIKAPALFMVACRQTYEENSPHTLDRYNDLLMKTVFVGSTSMVYLADFAFAHDIAVKILKDDAVADTISNYVKKHASVLGEMLRDEEVPQLFKTSAGEAFPFLVR